LGRKHGAEVTALAVLDAPGIEEATGPGTPASMPFVEKAEQRRMAEAHEHITKALEEIDHEGAEFSVRHRGLEIQGDPVEVITREALYYDLLVVGSKTYYKYETYPKPDGSLKKMLGRLATPVLVVGEEGLAFEKTRALIAYHDSIAAARSLRQFATMSAFEGAEVTLLTAHEDRDKAHELLGKAAEYLRAAGFEAPALEWTPEQVIEALRGHFLSRCDLVVAGTHTKRSWFDFLAVGSVTDFLIEEGGVPLFIGQ
jgi:nucleotide-binding universal stress UspA family protein